MTGKPGCGINQNVQSPR